jgi:hypothetical protein
MPVPLNPKFLAGYPQSHQNQLGLQVLQLRYNFPFLRRREIAVLHPTMDK